MTVQECPQCGAPAAPADRQCQFCKAVFFITNLAVLAPLDRSAVDKYLTHYKKLAVTNPGEADPFLGLGICYLNLKLYPLALKNLQNALEIAPDNGDMYYYSALAMAKGRRPRVITFSEIKEIGHYVQSAIQLNPTSAKYYIFAALIKHDYYRLNGLEVPPPDEDFLMTQATGVKPESAELTQLLACLPGADTSFLQTV